MFKCDEVVKTPSRFGTAIRGFCACGSKRMVGDLEFQPMGFGGWLKFQAKSVILFWITLSTSFAYSSKFLLSISSI